jgi:uncharacterized membrane protein YcaP (DUF421 family)
MVIKDGKVLEDNLKRERFTADELLEQLRSKSVFKVADVEFATLETSGVLSVMLKPENQPLTPKHLKMSMMPVRQPIIVIMDGEILDEGLSNTGFTREWLQTELDKLGLALQNVFLGQVDAFGQLYVDLYNDSIQTPMPQAKDLLFATLKKSCANEMEQVVGPLKNILSVS